MREPVVLQVRSKGRKEAMGERVAWLSIESAIGVKCDCGV